jgi:transcriptional antiterminator NusG
LIGTSIPPLAGHLPPRMMSSPTESAPAWCVAQAHGGFESFAKQIIEQEHRAEAAFVPMTRKVQIIKGCQREFRRPLIPGYVFVLLDLAREGWQRVNGARGVAGLIYATPERPARIPARQMQILFDQVDDLGFFVEKKQPIMADLKGELLKVTDGPFASFEGICQWSSFDRVKVLLHILGQERPVPLMRAQVQPAR